MRTERHVRLFKNGRNQALRIPREFELGCGSFVTTAPDPKSTAWPWLHRCVAHVLRRPLYAASFVSSGIGGPG